MGKTQLNTTYFIQVAHLGLIQRNIQAVQVIFQLGQLRPSSDGLDLV